MLRKSFQIGQIPAVLWGADSDKVIIAVHGNLSHKTDTPIQILAEHAEANGYQTLSFDLPEHGDRKREATLCKVQYCVKDLAAVMAYAKTNWRHISLFANSMGAYFSLLAYHSEGLEAAWFLSPVVDMRRIIENMMKWFDVPEEKLKEEEAVPTPVGQTLYWDYYCYVKEHPVARWETPTYILYGEKDDMCEYDAILDFTNRFSCRLEVVPEAEHYFHTPEQLDALNLWLSKTMQ